MNDLPTASAPDTAPQHPQPQPHPHPQPAVTADCPGRDQTADTAVPIPAPAESREAGTAALRRRTAWLVTAGFALLLAFGMRSHEMWRDEIQAWLLARDAPSWWGVLRTIRYEGHPGLWHLLLWPVARLSWNPVWMQVVHGIIASAAVWVLVRHAPLRLPFRVALPFGYVLCYEWGVISRNYALSALLMFVFCALFARRWRSFPWAACALAAACHTNVHNLILVMVLTPLLMIEFAVAVAGRRQGAERCKGRVCAGFLLILVGIATTVAQIRPPADSGFATHWHWTPDVRLAARAALTVLRAHVPIPEHADARFWNTNRAERSVLQDAPDASAALRQSLRVLAIALGIALALLWRRPWFLMHWTLGTLGLLVFFHVKYMGSTRHHAFHWLWAMVVLWMALDHAPWSWGRKRLDRLSAGLEALGHGIALSLTVLVQGWATVVAMNADARHVFSAAAPAGAWLRREGLTSARHTHAGQGAPVVSAVVGHARIPLLYYTGRNDWASYVRWDRVSGRTLQGRMLFRELHALRTREGRDLVFISSAPLRTERLPEGMTLAAAFDFEHALDRVWIYLWSLDPPS